MPASPFRRRLALPLGLQQLGLIIGALIVAQLVTLALTVLIPPAPAQRWNIEQVAASLLGETEDGALERRRMAGPPEFSAPGWLVSESSREALARRIDRPVEDVVLAFYTQLPVGGATVPMNEPRARLSGATVHRGAIGEALWEGFIGVAHAQAAGPGGGPPPGGMPGGAFPGGGFPGGGFPGGGPPGGAGPGARPPGGLPDGRAPGSPSTPPGGPMNTPLPSPATGSASSPAGPRAMPPPGPAPTAGPPAGIVAPPVAPSAFPAGPPAATVVPVPAAQPEDSVGDVTPSSRSEPTARQTQQPAPVPVPVPQPDNGAPVPEAGPATSNAGATPQTRPRGTPQPIPFRETKGLLSFTTPPFIEGDFIAAMRQPDGSWVAVAPKAEPFPNRWQKRVMLWFALSLLIVTPLVWLFTRRIVKPLEGFARAAEALGRDPAASVMPLSGPAEIGRAAHAFNQMRNRLHAFVDDRTAMVGAISHDLRTPLTRLRFRLEDVPDNQRDELLAEMDEMELMISQVIAFIRDASTPGPRERIDLAELVESTVANARVTGGDVRIEIADHIPVDVDSVGIRRLLANLIENAIKYGERARVRLQRQDDVAVAEIIDDGPGIPEDEIERAFEPFFRCEQARESEKPGSGLGLAVCRSIARSHGGDVRLEQRDEGFVACLTLPTVYGGTFPRAA